MGPEPRSTPLVSEPARKVLPSGDLMIALPLAGQPVVLNTDAASAAGKPSGGQYPRLGSQTRPWFEQTIEVPPHTPLWHWSAYVHRFLSSHGVPFGAMGLSHSPVLGLQSPLTWQTSAGSGQILNGPSRHSPPPQTLPIVHGRPWHSVPSASGTWTH